MTKPEWLDAKRLAQELCISVGSVHRFAKQGKLPPGQKLGARRLWRLSEVNRMIGGTSDPDQTEAAILARIRNEMPRIRRAYDARETYRIVSRKS
jgi:predicted site-specific integrase-resolvase